MKKPLLMGILNTTPDSFYDCAPSLEIALQKVQQMRRDGADIIDIGGESTRPNAEPVPVEEELKRVTPLLQSLKNPPLPFSIDTYKPKVAKKAVEAGASFINDISGFRNPEMIDVAKGCDAKLIVMHMQGTPKTMQNNPHYPKGVIEEIYNWLEKQVENLLKSGVKQERIILDPGIGFGKTVDDNLKIIHNLPKLKKLGFPLMIGLSRKGFIRKLSNLPLDESLAGTLTMNCLAILNGADIVRVHDVKEHRAQIDLLMACQQKL